MSAPRKISQVFGVDVADRLAALAIDLACDPPEAIQTYRTRIRAALIEEARDALEAAGIDWRSLVRARVERDREARRRYHESRPMIYDDRDRSKVDT